jgi:hypothetical protein
VLGGNASSEIRLWILGATSHMGNNNRWAREGGLVDEILIENLWRNPEGNAVLLDSLLLEKTISEPTLTLLLNTAADEVEMDPTERHICSVRAFCSQNQTVYRLRAPLFCDASGDGVLGYLAGASYRMGAEAAAEFGEGLAPTEESRELLGHSLYFYSRDTGSPVKYVAPSFALDDIRKVPRFRELRVADYGCRLWWLEYGGRLDTVGQTEEIKWELWRVAYGVWNYIKNSGRFPEAETLTLEWMGMIPGKRESRRFEGDIMLRQQDIVEQTPHPDAVSFGGWAIDLHPADGLYSAEVSCAQWHAKGVYSIPYRALYSKDIGNLFLSGRLISASHIAFGSTRVMATCAHNGQAVGMAAVLCIHLDVRPRDLLVNGQIDALQQMLLRSGQYIPGLAADDPEDLATRAAVSASSTFQLDQLAPDGTTVPLNTARSMLLPLTTGSIPVLKVPVDSASETTLLAELWSFSKPGNYTPDVKLAAAQIEVGRGLQKDARFAFGDVTMASQGYALLVLRPNPEIRLYQSGTRVTGVLSLSQTMNRAVAKSSTQEPPEGSGIDSFEFWLPERRPGGKNFALAAEPAICAWNCSQVINGFARPFRGVNAWVAAPEDREPWLRLEWEAAQNVRRIELAFDTDFDHPLESVLMGHPERTIPFCVQDYRIRSAEGDLLAERMDNHATRNTIVLDRAVRTRAILIEVMSTNGAAAAIFEVRCYAE